MALRQVLEEKIDGLGAPRAIFLCRTEEAQHRPAQFWPASHCSLDVFVKFLSVCEPQGENMKGLRACYTRICGYAERVRGARAGASLEGEAGVTAM